MAAQTRFELDQHVSAVARFGAHCLPAAKATLDDPSRIAGIPIIQNAADDEANPEFDAVSFLIVHLNCSIAHYVDHSREFEAESKATGSTDGFSCVRCLVPTEVSVLFEWHAATLGASHGVLSVVGIFGVNKHFVIILQHRRVEGYHTVFIAQMLPVAVQPKGSVLARKNETCEDRFSNLIHDPKYHEAKMSRIQYKVEKLDLATFLFTKRVIELLMTLKVRIVVLLFWCLRLTVFRATAFGADAGTLAVSKVLRLPTFTSI